MISVQYVAHRCRIVQDGMGGGIHDCTAVEEPVNTAAIFWHGLSTPFESVRVKAAGRSASLGKGSPTGSRAAEGTDARHCNPREKSSRVQVHFLRSESSSATFSRA